jgi:D-serine deaminase-like pyridoxal phosphate-dependent protein
MSLSPSASQERAPRSNPNASLIGVAGGRHLLDTPALLLDLDGLERNIARMAAFVGTHGVQLRPHAKSHKSVEIARRQVAAGAVGICCATLGEAETMVEAGIPGVLITSPIVTAGKIRRLVNLAAQAAPGGIMMVVDHTRNVDALAAAAAELAHPLDVLVDYAAGYYRTGAADAEAVVALARQVARYPQLRLRGLQAYAGNIQHIEDRAGRAAAAAAVRASIRHVIEVAAQAEIHFEIVTGAGTGSHAFDAEERVFTELQAGSYVFLDGEYSRVLADAGQHDPFDIVLFVQASVVSVNHPDWVTLDAGTKVFATDSGLPVAANGARPASRYVFAGDEHGKLVGPSEERPELGERVEFVTSHCDPTVNLHDVYHVVQGDTLVDIWPVDARGR